MIKDLFSYWTWLKFFRKFRSIFTFWVAKMSLPHLQAIRIYELELIMKNLPSGGRVLEIGGGTGWQAEALEKKGYDVSSIDVQASGYYEDRIWPVVDYDGHHIPFEDKSFDVVFSSNVMEHIPHIVDFQKEIHRVLKPDGVVLHLIPSSSWRFWSNVTSLIKYWWLPEKHGEHANNAIDEVYYFSQHWWTKLFENAGWKIESTGTNKLFYTGFWIMDSRISIPSRSKLSILFGGGI